MLLKDSERVKIETTPEGVCTCTVRVSENARETFVVHQYFYNF